MAVHLYFAGKGWELPDDVNVVDLKARIVTAAHTNGTELGEWVDVTTHDGDTVHLYVTPAVPVWLSVDAEYNTLSSTFG